MRSTTAVSPLDSISSMQCGRPLSPLTAREVEILGLAAQGLTNGRIGRELWITEQTVKFHLSNVYRKLGVSNRTEASHFAYVHGLLDMRPADVAA